MIAEAILALGGVGALLVYTIFGSDGSAAGASTDIIGQILAPFTLAVESTFTMLAYLAPLLIAVVPIYIVMSSRAEDENRGQYLAFGAVYGLVLYGIACFTGLDQLLIQEMRGSMFVGSALDMAVATLGASAEWIIGAVTGLALWGAGVALSAIGAFLDGLVGLGKAAEKGQRAVKGARKGVLKRLLGRD